MFGWIMLYNSMCVFVVVDIGVNFKGCININGVV